MLAEDAAVGDAVREDVGPDLLRDGAHVVLQLGVAADLCELRARSSATQHISFEET